MLNACASSARCCCCVIVCVHSPAHMFHAHVRQDFGHLLLSTQSDLERIRHRLESLPFEAATHDTSSDATQPGIHQVYASLRELLNKTETSLRDKVTQRGMGDDGACDRNGRTCDAMEYDASAKFNILCIIHSPIMSRHDIHVWCSSLTMHRHMYMSGTG